MRRRQVVACTSRHRDAGLRCFRDRPHHRALGRRVASAAAAQRRPGIELAFILLCLRQDREIGRDRDIARHLEKPQFKSATRNEFQQSGEMWSRRRDAAPPRIELLRRHQFELSIGVALDQFA